jgi:hypothetical protein
MPPLTVVIGDVEEDALSRTASDFERIALMATTSEPAPTRTRTRNPWGSKTPQEGRGLEWRHGSDSAKLLSDGVGHRIELHVDFDGRRTETALWMPRNLKILSSRPALDAMLKRLAARLRTAIPVDAPRATEMLERHRILCESMAAEAGDLLGAGPQHRSIMTIHTPSPLGRPYPVEMGKIDGLVLQPSAEFRRLIRSLVPSTVRVSVESDTGRMLLGVRADLLDPMERIRLARRLKDVAHDVRGPLVETSDD